MTKTQVEVITSVAAAPTVVAGGEGADRRGGDGAWRSCIGGCARGWDPCEPTVSLAAGALRFGPRCGGIRGSDDCAGAVRSSEHGDGGAPRTDRDRAGDAERGCGSAALWMLRRCRRRSRP